MSDWFQQTALSGSLVLALPVALVAGLISFFSPCVIPLLPGYLSYATGLSAAELDSARRSRLVTGAVLFVLGFAVVFVIIGSLTGAAGALFTHRDELNVVLGVITIVLGLAFLGVFGVLQRDWRIHKVPAVGLAAAPLLGFLFGVGWTPCVGPTLGVINALSVNEATAGRGALLAAVFALGLGLPFIAAAVAYRRSMRAFAVLRRHQMLLMRLGGAMMILIGLLLVTGWWQRLADSLQGYVVGFTVPV
ncbi:cytochrome c biogenesis CcdA family protein [Nocardioides okcheonensis]|uniref:cytochrome c biogenesis CcdA family protein n=1 Tax=Nocardioides okcheonensis TaxID=2894081 RepID=UPI001E3F1CC2|nr:cytochrome c biogenesis protein CcdA [Nocardioides okcheonensis]UFN43541.1 cytochrome c biogenesis protein CcdA [Nocardioides okcheonensis]